MFCLSIIALVFFFAILDTSAASYSPCFTRETPLIPKSHLMSKKAKPLVIGHRGNSIKYQENTLDGFTSLIATNADGFELDIYLTKDEQLVVYHDDNTMALTGVNKIMWESNAEDLTKIELPESINYNGNVYNYSKRRPIPMLKDVLDAMKDSDKLMYLEIKPSRLRNLTESYKVGRAVAKMVTEMGLVNRATINSFDPLKTLAAHQHNPDIPTGFFYTTSFWRPLVVHRFYQAALQLPGLKECVQRETSGQEFVHAMLQSGDIMKAINASFLDMDYKIYDNPLYSNNTFQFLRQNYSPEISAGAWTLYSVKMSKEEDAGQDAVIDSLVKQGAERLITDDVYRMLDKLNRPQVPTVSPISATRRETASVSVIVVLALMPLLLKGN